MTNSQPPNLPLPAASGSNGFDIYQGAVLRCYDLLVHGISNPWLWGIPTQRLRELYRTHLRQEHLELGVGTAKFLAEVIPQHPNINLGLADANPECLEYSRRRLSREKIAPPRIWHVDFNDPSPVDAIPAGSFASVGLTYVLHCLPSQAAKQSAIAFACRSLAPTGHLFGATLLGSPASRTWRTRALERFYQSRGIFQNRDDSVESIAALLRCSFGEVDLQQWGRALLFVARQPHQ